MHQERRSFRHVCSWVLRAEGLSHNVVQGQDFNIDDLYARMYGEAPVYHLLIFKHDEGFTHCVVIYGVQRDDLDRLYVMNPLYDLDDCYREMRVGEFCRA